MNFQCLRRANVANHSTGADWNGEDGNLTTVGSAGPSNNSYYGTADQGGNLWEWNEAFSSGVYAQLRGGSWGSGAYNLESSISNWDVSLIENGAVGFRVATIPEPSTYLLAALGIIALFAVLRWRK